MQEAIDSLTELLAIPWVGSTVRVVLTILVAVLLVWLVRRATTRIERLVRDRGKRGVEVN